MIIDSCIFFNELDVLKIRLEELYPVVDKFVIVESDKTFRGNKKPFYFYENKDLFKKYRNKIVYGQIYLLDEFNVPWERQSWEREKIQRNNIFQRIKYFSPEDILILSDVDEIPRREIIEEIPKHIYKGILSLNMHMYYYGLNVYDAEWGASRAIKIGNIDRTMEELRHSKPDYSLDNAGWHFSYLGDPQHISTKLKSFSHWELDTPENTDLFTIQSRMRSGQDLWGHGKTYDIIDVDDSWPKEVINNLDYYRKYIHEH